MPGTSILTPLVVLPLLAQSVMPTPDWATMTPMGLLALVLFVVLNRQASAAEKQAEAMMENAKAITALSVNQAELCALIRGHVSSNDKSRKV